MTDDPQTPTSASHFRKMAEMIDHNGPSAFGGAVVIVPPHQGGEPIEMLILDASRDPSTFWGNLQTKIQIVMQEINEKQRVMGGFGR